MINSMEEDLKHGQMVRDMMVNIGRVKRKVTEY